MVVTGKKPLELGMPYFIFPQEPFNVTWVGELPEPATFELKSLGGAEKVNYIVLPLNTIYKKASELCAAEDDKGQSLMTGEDIIGVWDVNKQIRYNPITGDEGEVSCNFINMGFDFDLNPGEVYLITIPEDRTWTQK